jgi:mono/diheme cytochrome c family protein
MTVSTMKQFLLAVAAVLASAMPAFAPLAFSQGATAGDAAHGKQLFLEDACYTCHGTTGAGGGPAGPKLAHDGLSPEAMMQQLRHPQTRMPAYTDKILPDKDAADIIAYIQSLSQGPAPAAKDIPLLNQ